MVKAVQAEDSLEAHFDGLLKARVPAEVGLLIGKPSVGSRDLVLAAVPNPNTDGQVLTLSAGGAATPAKSGSKANKGAGGAKGGSKTGGSSGEPAVAVSLDSEAIAEHALQVALMLPGGLAVLGLYLFAPDSGYSSCASQLAAALASIAADAASAAAPTPTGSTRSATAAGAAVSPSPQELPPQQELLLLHVDSSSRKFTMRACLASGGAAAAAGSLKPVELKFGPSLASLVALRTSHSFDLSLPATASAAQLQALLQDAAAAEAGRVMASLALLPGGGTAAAAAGGGSHPLADLLPPSGSGVSGGGCSISAPAWVDLYCSPPGAVQPPAATTPGGGSSKAKGGSSSNSSGSGSSSSACVGSCRLAGTIEALAYAHRRDAAAKALTELKQDVARSLAARLAALADEALAAAAEADDDVNGGGGAAAAAGGGASPAHPLLATAGGARRTLCGLPRRVLLPWSDLGLQVCAYLADDEGAVVAVERAQQLLPLPQLQESQVQEVEASATAAPPAGASAGAKQGAARRGGAGSGGSACGSTAAAAAAATMVAALSVGLAYFNLSGEQ